jgi:hypothetical protein
MNRFVTIGIDVAIIALICISLFSNGPLIKREQAATAAGYAPAATDGQALAEKTPH